MQIPTMKICDPDSPGKFFTINRDDFRSWTDIPWEEDPLLDFTPEPDQPLQDKPRRGRRPRMQEA